LATAFRDVRRNSLHSASAWRQKLRIRSFLLPFPMKPASLSFHRGGIQGNGAGSLCQGKQSSLVSYLFTAGVIGSRSKSLNARLAILSDRFTRSLAK